MHRAITVTLTANARHDKTQNTALPLPHDAECPAMRRHDDTNFERRPTRTPDAASVCFKPIADIGSRPLSTQSGPKMPSIHGNRSS
jgi:hypothetical protein